MRKNLKIAGIAAVLLTAGLTIAKPVQAQAAVLPDGLYVGEYDLGGKTWEEAQTLIEDHVSELSKQQVVLTIESEDVKTTARTLGYDWANSDTIEELADSYTKGNLIKRFLAIKELENSPQELPLEMAVDQEKCAQFVEQRCAGFVTEAQKATISRENGVFVIGKSAPGLKIDVESTSKALENALLQADTGTGVRVAAVIVKDEPSVKEEDLAGIKDVLGTFTTSYASSGAARSANVQVGAEKINGHILMPGETLSGYECMQPFTTENGYETAAAYENGQVVDSVGGGVCQIATTLYNAALRAELTITQRQNHSMTVSYVEPSMDAAIAGTYKDIKITNNYSTPIYVEGVTADKNLTFTIYGKETRPSNRTVEYVSETLATTSAGEPITRIDNSLAPGSKVTVQGGHDGMRSRLWKYVYIDGVETEKTILHTDTYNASKAIIRVGPSLPEVQPTLPEIPPVDTETMPVEPTAGQESTPSTQPGPGVTPSSTAAEHEQPSQPQPTEGPSGQPAPTQPSQPAETSGSQQAGAQGQAAGNTPSSSAPSGSANGSGSDTSGTLNSGAAR